ncbi:MAG: SPOR domain-containing protein [Gammaproteobacteria bacterium]
MERQLKERIVGATVIVALGIIVIPWLLDGPAQSSRPVEQAIELPPADQPGRTYTIPLDPGAGPPVQMENGSTTQPVPARPGAGAVQRPAPGDTTATAPAPQPVQPTPRPAPAPVTQPAPSPAPQAAPSGDGPWTVQVGSFSQPDNAQALQRRLASEGFEAFTSRVATDAGTMYRVRVGPVPERDAAEKLLARVRAAGHATARVVRAQD